jgi:multisubunit Na+/H+ antiporter MnhF subunit
MAGILSFEGWIGVLMAVLSVAIVLCFVRLYLGPTTANRAVAFDLISVNGVGLMVLFALRFDEPVLLDAALITAVLGFLSTVMLAHFIERSPTGGEED